MHNRVSISQLGRTVSILQFKNTLFQLLWIVVAKLGYEDGPGTSLNKETMPLKFQVSLCSLQNMVVHELAGKGICLQPN